MSKSQLTKVSKKVLAKVAAKAYPVISEDPHVQAFYEMSREKGNTHKFAEMVATRKPPRAMTDRELFEGVGTLGKQFAGEEDNLEYLVRVAKAHGGSVGYNDVYMANLARFPGDPEAFVKPGGGRGQIKEFCERNGMECHGAVETKHRQPEEDPMEHCIPLGEDLVQEEIRNMHRRDPEGVEQRLKKDPIEVREEVIDRHGWNKGQERLVGGDFDAINSGLVKLPEVPPDE